MLPGLVLPLRRTQAVAAGSHRLPGATQEHSCFLAFLLFPLVADVCGYARTQTYLCAPQWSTSFPSVRIYSLQSLYPSPHQWSQYQCNPRMGLQCLNLTPPAVPHPLHAFSYPDADSSTCKPCPSTGWNKSWCLELFTSLTLTNPWLTMSSYF